MNRSEKEGEKNPSKIPEAKRSKSETGTESHSWKKVTMSFGPESWSQEGWKRPPRSS